MLRGQCRRDPAGGRTRRTVCRRDLQRLPDPDILERAVGELAYRLRRPAYRVILLRFSEEERDLKIERLRWLLADRVERMAGTFFVLEADKVRTRPLLAAS